MPLWSVEPSTPQQAVREGSVRAVVEMIRATLPLDPEVYVLHATGALAAEFYHMKLPDIFTPSAHERKTTMDDPVATALTVSIRELAPLHVAYQSYKMDDGTGNWNEIHALFQQVQAWVRDLGYDPYAGLTIGALRMLEGRPASYECCVQVPASEQNGSAGISIQDLPGGAYAVVSIEKDPAVIGESIRRFYQEYVPEQRIELDGTRPTYEIYYESTMEYCIPIVSRNRA